MNFMHTWQGLIILLYIPALLISISELRRLAKYYKSRQPYVVAGREGKLLEYERGSVPMAKILLLVSLVPLFIVVKAHAALQSTARLTANTISSAIIPNPNPNTCTGSGNSTTVTVTGTGSGNINVSNSNNQNATTGNATSTNGGNATTGNATNCNGTNINITVH